jgi:hypothetical protein
MRVGPFSTLTVTFRFVGYRTDGELGLALIFGTVQPIGWEDSAMAERRRIKHKTTLEDRLAEEARRFKEAADKLPPGTARELLLRRARQADTAANINKWLRSPGLQPPTYLENLLSSDQKK